MSNNPPVDWVPIWLGIVLILGALGVIALGIIAIWLGAHGER
jgi:hypothetical protein